MNIGAGDFVECVDTSPHKHVSHIVARLTVGAVYRVRAVVQYGEKTGILLVEIVNENSPRDREYAYLPQRFRPVYRPRADFIESLLKPADAPAELVGA